MYFLNDKHSKYEYAVYCRVNGATPYIAKVFDSIDDVFRWCQEKEKRHNHYNQLFYIDNDFYKNQYPLNLQGTSYYKVLRRTVNDWEEFEYYEKSKPNYNNNVVDMFSRKLKYR